MSRDSWRSARAFVSKMFHAMTEGFIETVKQECFLCTCILKIRTVSKLLLLILFGVTSPEKPVARDLVDKVWYNLELGYLD